MGIRESALNTIASLANGDFVRMVTAAGASRKASLQTIAQHIIENYTGSTLAGSSQSVKAAIDGLNSTMGVLQNQSVYMGAAGTKEIDLTLGQYIVTVGKFNATNVAYSGLYIVTAHSSQSSVLAVASSGGAAVSISKLKLTITTTQTYMTTSITKVSTNINT